MNMYHPRLVPRPMFDKAARHSAEEPGGWGGIRTHGRLHVAGFEDRCLKPLGHPSTSRIHSGIAMREKPAADFQDGQVERDAFQIVSGHFSLIHPISFGGTGCARRAVNKAGPMAALHLS